MGWLDRLKEGLGKTRKGVQRSLMQLMGRGLDPEVLEEVEASLLGADVLSLIHISEPTRPY